MSLIGELKRRRVVQVAAVYAVTAWLLVQVAATVEAPLNLPDWLDTLVIILLAIGFPIALILSWAFNLTPDGLVREQGAGIRAEPVRSGRLLEISLIVPLLFAVGLLVYRDLFPDAPAAVRLSSLVRFPIATPPTIGMAIPAYQSVAISSSGTQIALAASDGVYVRAMSDLRLVRVPGSEGVNTRGVVLSPDGLSVAFTSVDAGGLVRVPVDGGTPVTIALIDGFLGGSWTDDGRIIFTQADGRIYVVDDDGGSPQQLIALESGQAALNPQLLPGGEWVLFTRAAGRDAELTRSVLAFSLETGEQRVLVEAGTDARFIESGYLVYSDIGSAAAPGLLYAAPFDAGTPAIIGPSQTILDNVSFHVVNESADFAVARNGSLVYRPSSAGGARSMAWVDQNGDDEPVGAPPAIYGYMRVSPDGRFIGVSRLDEERPVALGPGAT